MLDVWVVFRVMFAPRLYPVRLAELSSDWSMLLVCLTTAPVAVEVEVSPSQTFAPLPTIASDEFTMLTPLDPMRAFPERLTEPVLFSVTEELFAAIADCSSPAAVTLSIWLSRSGCFLVCLS